MYKKSSFSKCNIAYIRQWYLKLVSDIFSQRNESLQFKGRSCLLLTAPKMLLKREKIGYIHIKQCVIVPKAPLLQEIILFSSM